MSNKQPSIGQIRSFMAVYAHGSTVRAAEIMKKSQSLISAHISKLEDTLDTELFERRNGRLFATASAQKLSGTARELLETYQRLLAENSIRALDDELIMGAPTSLSMRMMPYIATKLMQDMPGIRVSLLSYTYQRIIDSVANGELDAGVVKLPVLDDRVTDNPLCVSPTVVVMPPQHPLAKRATVRPRDIGQQPLIRITGQRDHWEKFVVAFREEKSEPNYDLQVQGVGPACRLIATGVGIAIVNQLMAEEYIHDFGLVIRPFHARITHRFVWIVSPFSSKARLTQAFGEALTAYSNEAGIPLEA